MENKIVVATDGLIVHNGKVLILQRSSHDDVGAGTWCFPGGKIEFGESLENGLLREIREESGIAARAEKFLYVTSFLTDPSREIVMLAWLCSCEQPDVTLSEEHDAFLWAGEAELRRLLQPDILKDLEKNEVFPLLNLSQTAKIAID